MRLEVQTFLPYADFNESAKCLDNVRLNKQRVEVSQILSALAWETTSWRRHPAVLMWEGYELCLIRYGLAMCAEHISRGFYDAERFLYPLYATQFRDSVEIPPWLNDERLHASHRSSLLLKDFDHYSQFGWVEAPCDDYFWPTKSQDYAKAT